MKHQGKAVLGVLGCWLLLLLYVTHTQSGREPLGGRSGQDLERALTELQQLSDQNKEMQELMNAWRSLNINPKHQVFANKQDGILDEHRNAEEEKELAKLRSRLAQAQHDLNRVSEGQHTALSYETEYARRKLETSSRELWRFLDSQLTKMAASSNWEKPALLKKDLEGYRRMLESDFQRLRQADGADTWRHRKSLSLGSLVQRRLSYIQNPKDCASRKKILCDLHKGCGFGCQIHHLTYCLITAYAMDRTLVLDSRGWRYAPGGWESVFKPLSDSCNEYKGESARWGWINQNTTTTTKKKTDEAVISKMHEYKAISMPIVDNLRPRPDWMPMAIPTDLAGDLKTFHGDPPVWWIGQMVKYLFRPNKKTEQMIEDAKKNMGFQNIIVGVHVRRTDKINLEAAFHGIEEYMVHVAEFYTQLHRTQPDAPRRVYLATDDASLLQQARDQYPDYQFISDPGISKSAQLGSRYSDNSLRGVILDIHMLSRCDFLVCTFSSQVCRVAYEIMQTLHGDASERFRSLDDVFYYGGQSAHDLKVLEDHPGDPSAGLIDVQKGDRVGIAGNHWDGFSKGTNRRTGASGLYPSYKVENTVVTVDMPTYSEVPRDES